MSTSSRRSSKSTKEKLVNVELEKADEEKMKEKRPAQSQVDPSILSSIKHQSELEEELEQKVIDSQFKKRLMFYGGVAAALGLIYLYNRYINTTSKILPPDELLPELINNIAK